MMSKLVARIRMYRLNELGDCFLLSFTEGQQTARMLIDCGSFRNSAASIKRLDEVTTDIGQQLGNKPLDVVVGTHQHNDHLSGFVHCEKAFRKIGIDRAWLSWLDDPSDKEAVKIGKKFDNLRRALHGIHSNLRKLNNSKPLSGRLNILDKAMEAFGASAAAAAPPEIPAKAVATLKDMAKTTAYLRPGESYDMPGLPPGHVKIHVLGPPENTDLLYRKDPRAGESYDHALTSALLAANRFFSASSHHADGDDITERQYPFNDIYKKTGNELKAKPLAGVVAHYESKRQAWRNIDNDWMDQAGALALYLDTYTNNSSLALAIELVESKRVFLFAADAQTGNWTSWADVKWAANSITTDDLLARTVLYKVGHHGSHNSTLVDAFEKMTHPHLAALIPVNKHDANITKANGWKMPAKKLYARLRERTEDRFLRMDEDSPNLKAAAISAAWKKAGVKPVENELFYELEF